MRNRCAQAARRWQQGTLYVLLLFLPVSKAVIEIAFPALLLGWLVERCCAGGWRSSVWSRPALRPVGLALLAYVAVCAASILYSTHPALSIRGWIGKTLEYALYTVIVADIASEAPVARRGVTVLLASAVLVGLDGIWQQFVTGRDLFLHHARMQGRMTGPYENPGDVATFFIVLLPLALAWFDSRQRPSARSALGAIIVLLGACLVWTESQSAWAGFAMGAAYLFISSRSLRGPLAGVMGAFGVAAAFWLHMEGRLQQVVTFSDVGVLDRPMIWGAAWGMIRAHPIRGLGLNTFMANYLTYWVGGERMPRYAHNCYLQVWAETGIVGLALFLGFLWSVFARLTNGVGRREPSDRSILLGVTAGLLAFAVQAGADTNFYALRHAALFAVLAGLALGVSVRGDPRHAAA